MNNRSGWRWGFLAALLPMSAAAAPARPRSIHFRTVTVAPALVSVSTGTTQMFSCAVVATGGTSCTWSVEEGPGGGSITPGGLYSAPMTIGTYHLIAANPANLAEQGRATVSVVPAPAGGAGGTPGVWQNVTPPGVNLTDPLSCDNFGTKAVVVDPLRPQDVYVEFNCQGIWRSHDYGQTWSNGSIATGTNGSKVNDCTGMLAIAPGTPGSPILYEACIRGTGFGVWRSADGGVNWTSITPSDFSDFYAPAVDPYDGNHILMAGHQKNLLEESVNGGQTWTSTTIPSQMLAGGGTGGINFINTGDPTSTRLAWLWMSSTGDGSNGSWRTSDGGANWAQVEHTEHINGSVHSEIFQPGTGATMFMAGLNYVNFVGGVLKSTNRGASWTHLGNQTMSSVVLATSKHVYALYGWAAGRGSQVDPLLEVSPNATGAGAWTTPGTPAAMYQGPGQGTVTSDGAHNILFIGCYNAGLWRFVEP